MAEVPPHEPLETAHRPLPSVDIPLLKEERQAVRSRQMVGWALALVALGAGGGALAWLRAAPTATPDVQGTQPTPGTPLAAQAPAPTPTNREPTNPTPTPAEVVGALHEPTQGTPTRLDSAQRTTKPFGAARSFHHALLGMGLDETGATAVEKAVEKLIDFRRCHAEDRLVVERDAAGALTLFEYHASPTEYVRATRGDDGVVTAERVEVPVDRTRIRKGGSVRASLGDALAEVGLGRTLAGAFALALQRTVDFSKATRAGDTFRIIVDEERVNGNFLRYGTVHALEYTGQRTGTKRAFWYELEKDEGDFYDETGRAVQGGWLRTPVKFDHISSGFDPKRRHPILKRIMPHTGVDYAASTGTPVTAAAAGTVTFAGAKGPNGNLVSLRHDGGYVTHYAHLHRIQSGIKPGAKVAQRQMIGTVGSTGRSTGPHLHFGLEKHGRFVDPIPVINGPGRLLPAQALDEFHRTARRLTTELERIVIEGGDPSAQVKATDLPGSPSAVTPMD